MQIVPSDFVIHIQKGAFCSLQNKLTPKSAFVRGSAPDPAGELVQVFAVRRVSISLVHLFGVNR